MARITRRTVVKGLATVPVAGSAAALLARPSGTLAQDGEPVAIGSKDFPEQFILAEMYAQLLENEGITVERRLNLGGTAVAHEALVNGEISLYPEYTGTALTVVLGTPISEVAGTSTASPVADAGATPTAGGIDEQVYQIVADEYKNQFDLTWLDQSAFNNSQALAVSAEVAEEQGIATISDLAEVAGDLTIVAPPDFVEREDGLQGLQDFYGMEFGNVLSVAPGVRYQAVDQGQAEVVLAFGTDAEIATYGLVLLEDDRNLWPPYHVAPVVRQETLDANPALAETLNALAPMLTDDVMRELNGRVSGDSAEEPADVAASFLEESGLLAQ